MLDTALDIAINEGSTAVTMAAVVERMRVTRPVVYSCFADRAELVHALGGPGSNRRKTNGYGVTPWSGRGLVNYRLS